MNGLLDLTLTHAEEQKIHTPKQEWSDSFAWKVLCQDFEAAMEYRRTHEQRWELADRLYVGYKRQKVWEGTKIPRASIPIFVVFQQIESLLPKVLSALFSEKPSWFESTALPMTSASQALAARDLLMYQFEEGRRLKNQSIREVFRRSIKSGLIYGNGIVEMEWLDMVKSIPRYSRERVPITERYPYRDSEIELPNGKFRYEVQQKDTEKRYQLPLLSYVSLKDFWIEANCPSPQIQQARCAGTRALTTADFIKSLRGQPGYDIPSDIDLLTLAKHKPSRQSDLTKSSTDMWRGNLWYPQQDTTLDPGGKLIEVVTYYSADRCVWALNPNDVNGRIIYNKRNRYGFIPFFNAFYTDVLDRFYGMAVTDVVEGEHRLQGDVLDARIDELALNIHRGVVKKRGSQIPAYQLRRKPGRITEAENPKEDVVFEDNRPVLDQAFVEVAASEQRSQKWSGITDLAFSGMGAGAAGNSANRTAMGIGTQTSGAMSRAMYLVENIEDTFVEPILTFAHMLNQLFLDPDAVIPIVGQEIDPIEILNADVQFTMRASAKMQAKQALLQTFPLLVQTFLNPVFMQALQRQGQTVDVQEFSTMLLDTTGYRPRGKFVRPLNEQEQAALKQAQESESNVELTKQRERMQAMAQMQDQKAEAKVQEVIVGKALDMAQSANEEETPA